REDTGGSIRRIPIVGCELVSEPERNPETVGSLRAAQELKRALDCCCGAAQQSGRQVARPGLPGACGMRCDISAAVVERESSPAFAKRRDAAIAVLDFQQPLDAKESGFSCVRIIRTKLVKGQESSRCIIRIRNTSREICPGPTARGGVGVRMHLPILLIQHPQ